MTDVLRSWKSNMSISLEESTMTRASPRKDENTCRRGVEVAQVEQLLKAGIARIPTGTDTINSPATAVA